MSVYYRECLDNGLQYNLRKCCLFFTVEFKKTSQRCYWFNRPIWQQTRRSMSRRSRDAPCRLKCC